MDPDPDSNLDADPSIFIIDLQDTNKKNNFLQSISAYYFLKVILHHFSKIKIVKKKSQNNKIKVFLTILAL
jgi:hypothetical protein